MAQIILLQRMKTDNKLMLAMRQCMTSAFYNDLRMRALKGKNVIISWYGPQGSGKSFGAFYIDLFWARCAQTGFSASQVAFTNDELLALFGTCDKRTIYHKDEQTETFGIGSEREEAAIENVGAVARAQQLSLIYCSPSLKLHNVHYIIESTGLINEATGKSMHILYDGMKETPIGWISTWMPKLPQEFWDTYNKRKDEFITNVRLQRPVDRTKEYDDMAERFFRKFIVANKMKYSSKDALITDMMDEEKKNYTRDEWRSVLHLIEKRCRDNNIKPYTFPVW